jgi:hypothetical protein
MQAMMFSLCHTTARPDQWFRTAYRWYQRCAAPQRCEYVIVFEKQAFPDMPIPQPFMGLPFGNVLLGPHFTHRGSNDGWNACAKQSTGDFLISVSDDLYPPIGWDLALMSVIPDFKAECVLRLDFSGDPHLLTHFFLTRAYMERLQRDHGYDGGFNYPAYLGMRTDDDFTACAEMDGVIVDATHIKFDHRHPEYKLAEWDELYKHEHRSEAFVIGDKILARRRAEGFRT